MLEHPHARITLSEAATWGSADQSEGTTTEAPASEEDEELALVDSSDDEEIDFDDEWVVHGGLAENLEPSGDTQLQEGDAELNTERDCPVIHESTVTGDGETEEDHCDIEPEVHHRRRRKNKLTQRERRQRRVTAQRNRAAKLDYASAVMQAPTGHLDLLNKDALQKLANDEPKKRIVTTKEVTASTGAMQERWKLAAEAELTNNFLKLGAFHESTSAERAAHGRPLPMLCVWTQADDLTKCRACVCGNFEEVDPTQQSWTAQAEPSSLFAALKLGRLRGWTVSKHDVKGAFLNADIPEGKLVIVQPPALWVKWGLVAPGVTWTLDKAVYGLRESPKWWGDERDKQLRNLKWTDTSGLRLSAPLVLGRWFQHGS